MSANLYGKRRYVLTMGLEDIHHPSYILWVCMLKHNDWSVTVQRYGSLDVLGELRVRFRHLETDK